jgi:hypothetical protein
MSTREEKSLGIEPWLLNAYTISVLTELALLITKELYKFKADINSFGARGSVDG